MVNEDETRKAEFQDADGLELENRKHDGTMTKWRTAHLTILLEYCIM